MSIPYHPNLSLNTYHTNSNWYQKEQPKLVLNTQNQTKRALNELVTVTFKQSFIRSIQFIRDAARLVLKVPVRALTKPPFLEKNWNERERVKVNVKLTGYALAQLAFVLARAATAFFALLISPVSEEKSKWLLDKSEEWTIHLDGRGSQLEALKEEGAKQAKNQDEFNAYRNWLYKIDAKLCRKLS